MLGLLSAVRDAVGGGSWRAVAANVVPSPRSTERRSLPQRSERT